MAEQPAEEPAEHDADEEREGHQAAAAAAGPDADLTSGADALTSGADAAMEPDRAHEPQREDPREPAGSQAKRRRVDEPTGGCRDEASRHDIELNSLGGDDAGLSFLEAVQGEHEALQGNDSLFLTTMNSHFNWIVDQLKPGAGDEGTRVTVACCWPECWMAEPAAPGKPVWERHVKTPSADHPNVKQIWPFFPACSPKIPTAGSGMGLQHGVTCEPHGLS